MTRSLCAYASASATAITCGSSASRASSVFALGDHVARASGPRRASSRRTARRRPAPDLVDRDDRRVLERAVIRASRSNRATIVAVRPQQLLDRDGAAERGSRARRMRPMPPRASSSSSSNWPRSTVPNRSIDAPCISSPTERSPEPGFEDGDAPAARRTTSDAGASVFSARVSPSGADGAAIVRSVPDGAAMVRSRPLGESLSFVIRRTSIVPCRCPCGRSRSPDRARRLRSSDLGPRVELLGGDVRDVEVERVAVRVVAVARDLVALLAQDQVVLRVAKPETTIDDVAVEVVRRRHDDLGQPRLHRGGLVREVVAQEAIDASARQLRAGIDGEPLVGPLVVQVDQLRPACVPGQRRRRRAASTSRRARVLLRRCSAARGGR